MLKFYIFGLAAILLVGCQSQSLYYWDDYEKQTYEYLKDKPISELIDNLEEMRQRAYMQEKPLPPTFYAHLGLLYEKAGDTGKFKELLIEEREKFPESAIFFEMFLKEGNANVKTKK